MVQGPQLPLDLDIEYGEETTCECPECGSDFVTHPGETAVCPTCGMTCDPCDPASCGQAA